MSPTIRELLNDMISLSAKEPELDLSPHRIFQFLGSRASEPFNMADPG